MRPPRWVPCSPAQAHSHLFHLPLLPSLPSMGVLVISLTWRNARARCRTSSQSNCQYHLRADDTGSPFNSDLSRELQTHVANSLLDTLPGCLVSISSCLNRTRYPPHHHPAPPRLPTSKPSVPGSCSSYTQSVSQSLTSHTLASSSHIWICALASTWSPCSVFAP